MSNFQEARDLDRLIEIRESQKLISASQERKLVTELPEQKVVSAENSGPKLLNYIPGKRRYLPGVASHSGELPEFANAQNWLKGSHGNAAKVPRHIAEKLAGRQFNNFDEFREAFWIEVGNDPILSKQFSTGNKKLMRSGQAPVAVYTQQVGKRFKYELDHLQEIQNGGNVYDMNNIIIRTPLNHIKGK